MRKMNPRTARIVGYVLLFFSFPFFGAMAACMDIAGGLLSMLFLIIGAGLFAVSVIWMVRKVRCPHCDQLLHLKLYDISVCPYCGRSTDPNGPG